MRKEQPSYKELINENETLKKKLTLKLIREREFKESIEKFRNLLDTSNESVILLDINGLITDVSYHIVKLTGYSSKYFIGKSFPVHLVHADDLDFFTKSIDSLLLKKEIVKFDYRFYKSDKVQISINHTAIPIFVKGQFKGAQHHLLEIKNPELVGLTNKAEQYHNFIKDYRDAIYCFEFENPIDISIPFEKQIDLIIENAQPCICNSAMNQICTFTGEVDFLGKSLTQRFQDKERKMFRKFISDGYKFSGYEIEQNLPGEKKVYFLCNDVGVIEHGKLIKIWGTATDITDRKITEQELLKAKLKAEENENLYRLLAENASDVVWLMDLEFNFTYISPSAIKFYGYSPEERKSMPFEKFYKPNTIKYIKTIFSAGIEEYYKSGKNEIHYFELEGIHKEGYIIYFEVSAKFVTNKNGQITGLQGTTRDISDKKLLEKSKNFILDLYKKSEIYGIDKILNTGVEKAIEFTQSEIGFLHFINPNQKSISFKLWSSITFEKCNIPTKDSNYSIENAGIWAKSLEVKKPVIVNDYESAAHKKGLPDGHIPIKRIATVPIFEGDNVVAILGVGNKKCGYSNKDIDLLNHISMNVWNITRRKKTEIANRKLKIAVESSKTCIVITDYEGIIEYANPYFTECTGYLPNEYLGKKASLLKSNYHDKEYYKNLWINIKAGKAWEGEFCNRKKNGDLYWEKTVISPIINETGEITHFVAVKADITDAKKINEELILAKDKAEESERLKSAFLQNLSHEIRTPLNSIVGFSFLLFKPQISEAKRNSYMSMIQTSNNQLLSIVTDLLTISSIETKQEKLHLLKANVNEIIIELINTFNKQASQQNIILNSKNQLSNSQSEIYTDSSKLVHILTNLISNALKFTYEGYVEFGCNLDIVDTQDLAYLQFHVKDTGIGISKEQQDKIFEPFRQADLSINKNYGGTGLGLSICKGFVELLGGKIWVESDPKQGACFYFTIPYNPVSVYNTVSIEEYSGKNLPIVMVAEDEEYNYLFIKELLSDMNIKLIHVKNGKEAVEICKLNPDISLILMDIKMPVMDGYTAALEIKKTRPDLPIIAQTAYALEHEKEKYKGTAFDGYFIKPFIENELKSTVLKYITI